jgi:hypothetical protein
MSEDMIGHLVFSAGLLVGNFFCGWAMYKSKVAGLCQGVLSAIVYLCIAPLTFKLLGM